MSIISNVIGKKKRDKENHYLLCILGKDNFCILNVYLQEAETHLLKDPWQKTKLYTTVVLNIAQTSRLLAI